MLAALRAEKQRHAAKADYRRRRFTEALERHLAKEAEVLRQKHDVPPRCSPSQTRIGFNVPGQVNVWLDISLAAVLSIRCPNWP